MLGEKPSAQLLALPARQHGGFSCRKSTGGRKTLQRSRGGKKEVPVPLRKRTAVNFHWLAKWPELFARQVAEHVGRGPVRILFPLLPSNSFWYAGCVPRLPMGGLSSWGGGEKGVLLRKQHRANGFFATRPRLEGKVTVTALIRTESNVTMQGRSGTAHHFSFFKKNNNSQMLNKKHFRVDWLA